MGKIWWQFRLQSLNQQGFTLIELLAVIVMVGILAGIAAPGWLAFLERQRVSDARNEVHQGLLQAQAKAQQTSTKWRFGIRQQSNSVVEWAIYQDGGPTANTPWTALHPSIQLDSETSTSPSNGIYSTIFDYQGNNSKLITITLSSKNNPTIKRCVIVSTLLGKLRESQEQSSPNASGKYCY